jgi:hypothetical protein
VKQLRRILSDLERGSIELFLRPYEDDFISSHLETIIRLYGNIKKFPLDEPVKENIWLDDRTYSAYHSNSSTPPDIPRPGESGSAPFPDPDPLNERSQTNVDQDAATDSHPGGRGDAYSQSASARYSPTSRRPKVPLTAKMLHTWLLEEVFTFPFLQLFRTSRYPARPQCLSITTVRDLVLFGVTKHLVSSAVLRV